MTMTIGANNKVVHKESWAKFGVAGDGQALRRRYLEVKRVDGGWWVGGGEGKWDGW
jgi:hypothetical protein